MPIGIIAESLFEILNSVVTKLSTELNETLTLQNIAILNITNLWWKIQIITKSKWTLSFDFVLQEKKDDVTNLSSLLLSKENITVSDLFK